MDPVVHTQPAVEFYQTGCHLIENQGPVNKVARSR
jgi:hypothetical protein